MTKLTLMPVIQQMTDFGTAEPFVARISLGLCDLLRGLDINELDKKKAQEHILETFHEFCNAFLSLREIVEMESGCKQLLLTNKRKAYQDLYSYCWRGYKDRMPNILKAFKIDIGFLFQKEEQFNNGAKEFTKNYPKIGHEFIKMV